MALFQYKGYDSTGREAAGTLEAESIAQARERLRKDGLYPSEIARRAEGAAGRGRAGFFSKRRGKVSSLELAAATRQVATLLGSGETLMNALSIVKDEVSNEALKDALSVVRERVSAGRALGAAMLENTGVFPETYCRMVEAAEESGTLDAVLARLAELLEARAAVAARVQSALVYPLAVTTVSFGVLIFLVVFVIPRITRIFEDTEAVLPFVTVVLLGVVNLLRGYWFVLAAIAIAGYFGLGRYKKTAQGKRRIEDLLLKVPYLGGLLKTYYAANFSRTLSSLLASGVPILKAFDLTSKALNHSGYSEVISKACRNVTEGGTLSQSLKGSPLFPDLLVHMVAIGERSGSLDVLLDRAASAYEKDFERSVAKALALFEPALVVAMGAVVGFIVLAILLPIFELNQLIR